MNRFFNTAGPIKPELHYNIPPLQRIDLDDVLMLIDQQKYFVLHAPRQVGKTSFLLALMAYLNERNTYHALYVNVEIAQAARENVAAAMQAIIGQLAGAMRTYLDDRFLLDHVEEILAAQGPFGALNEALTLWARHSEKPLVVLIDEIDSLIGDTLVSVLRQVRAGYADRPHSFPQSIILCGVRDVRDYRIHAGSEKDPITGGSAFNIKAESMRMSDFIRAEVERLYQQHTAETGQHFTTEAIERMWELTQGQPWLVNALAYETCFRIKTGRDRTQPVTLEMVTQAKENLILRRETHLDQLVDKLQEPRVQRVMQPMLAGEELEESIPTDDIQYVIDLGLIQRRQQGLVIANPIYQEIIPRELTWVYQLNLEPLYRAEWYLQEDGRLAMQKLLAAFQQFFREHSESWLDRFAYREAGPQLLLQAFLQRIINGGGQIIREYGLGRGRTDLLIIWPHSKGSQRVVIETKLRRGKLETTIQKGLAQTYDYMDKSDATEGHLVIFDRGKDNAWAEKIFDRDETVQGKTVHVWGM